MRKFLICLICLFCTAYTHTPITETLISNHIECEVGKLVFDYSTYLIQNVMTSVQDRLPMIFDALNLDRCNMTKPEISRSNRLAASQEILLASSSRKRIYVDPEQGSDAGEGDIKRPLRSLKAALVASRKTMQPAIIILRGGRYELDTTVVLDSRDSGISIVNYPHEEPILSGGRELDLDWKPWSCHTLAKENRDLRTGKVSCWSASTAEVANLDAIEFNQLFIRDRRAIRARHPNAGNAAVISAAVICHRGSRDLPPWQP